MESLNLLLILIAGWLVYRRPQHEGLAFGLLLTSVLLTLLLFSMATRTALLPNFNL
jgi:hypothetical protein